MAQSEPRNRLHDQIPPDTAFGEEYFIGGYLRTVTYADVYSILHQENIADAASRTAPGAYRQLAIDRIGKLLQTNQQLGLIDPRDASQFSPSSSPSTVMAAYFRASREMGTKFPLSHRDEERALRSYPAGLNTTRNAHKLLEMLSGVLSFISASVDDKHTTFEARVYDMTGLDAHGYSRRSRVIQRLKSRTVLKAKWKHLRVVIYSTDPPNENDQEPQNPESINRTQQTQQTKSARQRESQRLRQYDRRRAKAYNKAQPDSYSEGIAPKKTKEITTTHAGDLTRILDKKSLALLLLLYFAFEIDEQQRMRLPADAQRNTRELVKSLGPTSWRLSTPEDTQKILDHKDRELVGFKRLLAKLPTAEYLIDEQLDGYFRRRAQVKKRSDKWRTIHNLIKPAMAQQRIIQAGYRTIGRAIKLIMADKVAVQH